MICRISAMGSDLLSLRKLLAGCTRFNLLENSSQL